MNTEIQFRIRWNDRNGTTHYWDDFSLDSHGLGFEETGDRYSFLNERTDYILELKIGDHFWLSIDELNALLPHA